MRFCSPVLFAAGLLSAPLLFAQTPTPAVTTATAATAVANGDAILATWLHAACSNEIALAAIAVKQAKHDDVRAFAQAIVDKHTAFAAKLQPFATGAEAQPKPNDGKRSTEASVGRATTMVPFDHAGLIRELAAKCLASESKLLAAKPAGEFDLCFVMMQLAAHGKGVDTLAVFRSRATPALAAVIDEGTKLYAAHHEQALGLQTKLAAPVVEARGGR
jgi:predicted outer membrane protein